MTGHSTLTGHNAEPLITRFLQTTQAPIHAYNEEAAANKVLFHRHGKALLKRIAEDLGYRKDSYDLRSNMAGIAVSGEITLHTDDLYIQFSCSAFGSDLQIMYRRCQHRRDYTGLRNHFLPFQALCDYNKVLSAFQTVRASAC